MKIMQGFIREKFVELWKFLVQAASWVFKNYFRERIDRLCSPFISSKRSGTASSLLLHRPTISPLCYTLFDCPHEVTVSMIRHGWETKSTRLSDIVVRNRTHSICPGNPRLTADMFFPSNMWQQYDIVSKDPFHALLLPDFECISRKQYFAGVFAL